MTLRVKAQDVKIEESRLALKLAAEQERIQQTIFQEMSAGVLVFSSDGFLVRANPAARTLLGVVPLPAAATRRCWALIPLPAAATRRCWALTLIWRE